MLYRQLKRVNELDSEINNLHKRLASLYAERSQLISGTNPPKEPVSLTDPRGIYDNLASGWDKFDVKMPAYKSVSGKIRSAAGILDRLQAENPHLANKLSVVAVPPYATVAKLAGKLDLEFPDRQLAGLTAKSKAWKFLVVTDYEFCLPVKPLMDQVDDFFYKDYDCRALGVLGLIAAELQGVKVTGEDSWTLLLADYQEGRVPCAIKRGDKIVIDTDEAGSLIGNNNLLPVIEA
jgi:hypothetical protein